MQFAVERREVSGVPVVQVTGELDLATAPQLTEALDAEVAHRPPLLAVDLTTTTFLDSSGARALALAARTARRSGSRLELVCPADNRAVQRVIQFLQLEALLPLREDVAALTSGEPRT